MLTKKHFLIIGACAIAVAAIGAVGLRAQVKKADAPANPVGAWFGIARPCTPSRFPVPVGTDDQPICQIACGGRACPPSNFPVDEVTMIPTLLGDGTVLADDFAELLDHHSTAQGKWEFVDVETVDGRKVEKYQATFVWFQPRSPFDVDPRNPVSIFAGVTRPRFVTFFDRDNPDVMRGFIQPYFFPFTDRFGTVNLQSGTPFPTPDPIPPLPPSAACNPQDANSVPYCFGVLHFVVRRIQAH